MTAKLSPVSVIGLGVIGASWTALFLARGMDVVAWDPNRTVQANFEDSVRRSLSHLDELGQIVKSSGKLSFAPTLEEAVSKMQWIQENIPERVDIKRALYKEIEQIASKSAVIASSTSSFTWTELSADLEHKARFITAHPFNPPHLMPLVEIFAADDGIRERARSFYEAMGRKVVLLRKDAVGHIANRLSSALWREAIHIVAEGIADVSDVDAALVNGPGLRWSVIGAHMAYHLGGGNGGIEYYLDHLGPSQERRWATLGNPRLTSDVCQKLISGIAEEAAGRSIEILETERDLALISALRSRRT
ncbi:3-hydroxyacyl-CoA dehydrogenase NAD-binding domain-containing protein [Mesorhizobium sp. M1365]|uniref:3-hydroxyacyl-CoA dehydrogenase NAD-binding domain-containing protein n=1 Tax=Mesorhizobium sp. M1365 TaxID=2957090 RepID=UPI003339EC07